MKAQFEAISTARRGSSCLVFRRQEAQFYPHWHYHPEFELTYIVQSQGTRLIGDRATHYQSGELVFLGSHLPHSWTSDPQSMGGKMHEALVIQFPKNYFCPSLLELPEWTAIRQFLESSGSGIQFYGHVVTEVSRRMRQLLSTKGLETFLQLTEIVQILATSRQRKNIATPSFIPNIKLYQQARFEKILRLIEEKSSEPLSLTEVARAGHLSPSSFSRLFRKMTQQSFIGYLNEFRIGKACHLLVETDKSISEIAYESGFANLSNFNRRFLNSMRLRPKDYRKIHSRTSH